MGRLEALWIYEIGHLGQLRQLGQGGDYLLKNVNLEILCIIAVFRGVRVVTLHCDCNQPKTNY